MEKLQFLVLYIYIYIYVVTQVSEAGVQCAVRYYGAMQSWHWHVIMQCLYLTHQWRNYNFWPPDKQSLRTVK